jgi:hypothetical protein
MDTAAFLKLNKHQKYKKCNKRLLWNVIKYFMYRSVPFCTLQLISNKFWMGGGSSAVMLLNFTGGVVKKWVVLQVNDTAVRTRLIIFVSKGQLFTDYKTDWRGRGERRGVPPL